MIQVFEDCSEGKYQKQVVASVKGVKGAEVNLDFVNGSPVPKGIVTESPDGSIILENVSLFKRECFSLFCKIAKHYLPLCPDSVAKETRQSYTLSRHFEI